MEDSAKALAAETELKKFGQLVEDVGALLTDDKYDLENYNEFDFIKVTAQPCESINLASVAKSENTMMSKIVLALTSIGHELEFCYQEAKDTFLDPLLFYGEALEDPGDEAEAMKCIARMLPIIQKASCFVDHCAEVVMNTIHQLCSLRDPQATSGAASFAASQDVHVQVIYERLAKLLSILVTIDGIILGHDSLRGHWATYRRYIKAGMMDPESYNVNIDAMTQLEKLLSPAESKVIDGNMLKTCLDQEFNKNGFYVSKNSNFCEEFLYCIRTLMAEVEVDFNSQATAASSNYSVVAAEPDNRLKLVGLFCLIALHNRLFHTIDKKLLNKIWELCKKFPGVTLHGKVMWFPEQFIMAHLPSVAKLMDKKLVQTLATNRHMFLQNYAQGCQNETKLLHHQLNGWVVKMENIFRWQPGTNLTLEHIERATNLLLQGLAMASELRTSVTTVLNLHAKLSVPLTKKSVIALCKTMEILKAVEATYHRHSLATVSLTGHICQKLMSSLILTIGRAKTAGTRGGSERKDTQSKLDILSALILAETTIAMGPTTKDRKLVTEIALSFASQAKTFNPEETVMVAISMKKLGCVTRLNEYIDLACDTSFIYWHRLVISVYFEHLFETKVDAYRINYIFRALRDCSSAMRKVKHLDSAEELRVENSYCNEIEDHFDQKILHPLCQHLETDLRLQAHSHLQLDDRNPFKVGLGDVSAFLSLPPIPFMGGKYIYVKAKVEAYLQKTFYNLTTVALHNWRTYGEMRALATHKYKAETVDDHLPAQTLEQGLDVLEIMRNIHVFVSNYLYNLNHQIFVESGSQNKHLNTINIRHIANSIRTHGTGIMNTTVNFSYQFLRKKFGIFSQFLFDDQIKSRLAKDARFFKENSRTTLDQKYPFDRAAKFNKGIRKLGTIDGQSSYLDQFRLLISQIGNTMGYVRMIKAGGLHFVSNSIRFVPDLDDIPNFEELTLKEEVGGGGGNNKDTMASEAAKTLDEVVANLGKNFSDNTEYFQLLVNVFGKQLQEDKHPHLRNFYAIVPPLTVNYVEHMIAAKEKISKNNFNGAAFTDDGLPMGVAYILRLLNQGQTFDSLHWFESVREKYIREKSQVERQSAEAQSKSDEKLRQTLALTLKRLETYQKEFELLYYNLSSARIFFRMESSCDDGGDEDCEEND